MLFQKTYLPALVSFGLVLAISSAFSLYPSAAGQPMRSSDFADIFVSGDCDAAGYDHCCKEAEKTPCEELPGFVCVVSPTCNEGYTNTETCGAAECISDVKTTYCNRGRVSNVAIKKCKATGKKTACASPKDTERCLFTTEDTVPIGTTCVCTSGFTPCAQQPVHKCVYPSP